MKPGRNDPCSCGSGKKYKNCCLWKAEFRPSEPSPADIGQLNALFNTGRHIEVENLARSLLELYPDAGSVWNLLGISLSMQGKDPLLALQKTAHLLPDNAGVHNNLGNVLQDLRQFENAAASYRHALRIKPNYAMAHNNLGMVLQALGQLSEAADSYRHALKIEPNFAHAYNNLGNALKELGQLDAALASYRSALKIVPDYADAHSNLGCVLEELGQFDAAVNSCRRAVELKPDLAEAHSNLGNALKDLGQFDAAVNSCRRAVELKPGLAEAHNIMGLALQELGQLDGAVSSYRQALKFKPDFAEAHNNLGNALNGLGQHNDAVFSLRHAVAHKPDFAEAHVNLGNALQDLWQFDDAVASYLRALKIKPDYADAHNNLGNSLKDIGQLDAAMTSYRRALEINPNFALAHNNLGNILKCLGQLDGAAASYRRALEIKPNLAIAYSNLLYMHAFTRNISPELERDLASNWENVVLNESERSAARNRSFDYPARAGRKLRVGVVSAEIGAVAEFLEPLKQLDHNRFHVTLFSTTSMKGTRAAQFKGLAEAFKPLVGMTDNKAAELIRSDQIDILIDTTAHLGGCRLGIFAHRAAPVQCHYIGYHGSTGLTEMDWFIADEVLLPASCDAHFRESIWRLPRLWIAYRGDASLPDNRWQSSPDGTVWLGSFNNLTKVREETLALWARVLNAIPESKLFLKDVKATDHAIQQNIRMGLGRFGISTERVKFAGHVSDWSSHMTLYDRLDIALDTIPLNSGTTAFDALWMGVPLVALEGDWMGARMSNTILKALGKPEWVAQSEDEYVEIVTALAQDVEGRKSLRAAQRALMAGSPLCDAKGLTRALEAAFESRFDLWAEKRENVSKESCTK